jgi:hypothetical protein
VDGSPILSVMELDPVLTPFAPLAGEWTTEATHPMLPGVVVPGTATYEWLGAGFLVERSTNDHPQFPDAVSIFGPGEDGVQVDYFDERGVKRIYRAAVEDGAFRTWRDEPGFRQRLILPIGGDVMEGVWELDRGDGFQPDLAISFRRRATA